MEQAVGVVEAGADGLLVPWPPEPQPVRARAAPHRAAATALHRADRWRTGTGTPHSLANAAPRRVHRRPSAAATARTLDG
ncbi:hypothetical protein GCM10027572_05430 [Flexivirga lutea]